MIITLISVFHRVLNNHHRSAQELATLREPWWGSPALSPISLAAGRLTRATTPSLQVSPVPPQYSSVWYQHHRYHQCGQIVGGKPPSFHYFFLFLETTAVSHLKTNLFHCILCSHNCGDHCWCCLCRSWRWLLLSQVLPLSFYFPFLFNFYLFLLPKLVSLSYSFILLLKTHFSSQGFSSLKRRGGVRVSSLWSDWPSQGGELLTRTSFEFTSTLHSFVCDSFKDKGYHAPFICITQTSQILLSSSGNDDQIISLPRRLLLVTESWLSPHKCIITRWENLSLSYPVPDEGKQDTLP